MNRALNKKFDLLKFQDIGDDCASWLEGSTYFALRVGASKLGRTTCTAHCLEASWRLSCPQHSSRRSLGRLIGTSGCGWFGAPRKLAETCPQELRRLGLQLEDAAVPGYLCQSDVCCWLSGVLVLCALSFTEAPMKFSRVRWPQALAVTTQARDRDRV